MRKLIYISLFLFTLLTSAEAQEYLAPLSENPVIKEALAREHTDQNLLKSRETGSEAGLVLPFFDDFKATSIYPNTTRWIDRDAFINDNYDKHSANRGVATLDALDEFGNLQENASQFPFISDHLTSAPIRLDSVFTPFPRAITLSDSVYFSFFYQPQGNGNAPESFDSLVLEFGFNTGELIFSGYYDSINVPASLYIIPGDTIRPGDTIFSPYDVCDSGLYIISNRIYTIDDEITIPCDSVFEPEYDWKRVWSSEGKRLNEFYDTYQTWSKQVIIHISDTQLYYRPDFRFRFFNYASISDEFNPSWRGNSDHWNIDYVYLNINRTAGDTVYRDVSFANQAPSFLKRYHSMPYNQYIKNPTAEVVDSIRMDITNLDTNTFNTQYFFNITNEEGLFPFTYDGEFCNLRPYFSHGYQNCLDCDQHACPSFNYLFPLTLGDSALFRIDHIILGDFTPIDTIGDTITYYQKFYNYYAYDDGSPEFGYGLKPAGAQLAYRFSLNTRDTLRAVQMYFNRVLGDVNQQFFNLRVWGDANGKPGALLYEEQNVRVAFTNSLIHFHTYFLKEPLMVNGVFYVGWEQITDHNLQLGFDRNSQAQSNIFFNTDGQWVQSSTSGALMIRPMLGEEFEIIGIDENETLPDRHLTIYPNPLNHSTLHVEKPEPLSSKDDSDLVLSVFNIVGQRLHQGPYEPLINLGTLEPGMYIVNLTDPGAGRSYSSKLIISR